MIHILHTRATRQQLGEMLEALGDYIKLAVDIRRGILAGGGVLHADCEALLLEEGSRQQDIWGADFIPATQVITYDALINIRPHQNNPSMQILDESIRSRIDKMVKNILEAV